MCFYTRKLYKLTAKEDIVCYKTAYYNTVKKSWWQFWKKETIPIELFSVYYHYRYVINKPNPEINLVVRKFKDYYQINRGYHSYIDPDDSIIRTVQCCYSDMYKVLKCVIPKGSVYYKSDRYYVSSNLIVTDII